MKYNITNVRDYLFDTLEALQDKEKPLDLARAKAIADTAQVIINSAKVEVEYLKATGQKIGTGFLPLPDVQIKPSALHLTNGGKK